MVLHNNVTEGLLEENRKISGMLTYLPLPVAQDYINFSILGLLKRSIVLGHTGQQSLLFWLAFNAISGIL